MRLYQKRGVPDPSDTDLSFSNFWKRRLNAVARSLSKQRRDQNRCEEIALMPIRPGPKLDSGRTFGLGAILRVLADDVPLAFF